MSNGGPETVRIDSGGSIIHEALGWDVRNVQGYAEQYEELLCLA